MNGRRILFSAIVTAVIGATLGFVLVEMKSYDYSDHYPNRDSHPSPTQQIVIGAVIGMLVGATQEYVRELKKQQDRQDREEQLRDYLHTYLSLRDIENKPDE